MNRQLFLMLFNAFDVTIDCRSSVCSQTQRPPGKHTHIRIDTEHIHANTARKIILAYIMACLAQPEVYLYIMFAFK